MYRVSVGLTELAAKMSDEFLYMKKKTSYISTFCRPEEANRQTGGGRHAGRDEGGEAEDGHGEEGVHTRTLSLFALPPAHYHRHPPAALPATVGG